ncbi:hypothetical protein [Candidatus Sororendozoicomonas aggregata]|uniref:hypothetical protein n=1 Tax=Candidatus Sororendozoicomonas aggregata TaxID=3073239 RepID=UPI002ED044E6
MDINEIRRHNARLLADQFKTLSGFADYIDRSQTYVSRFIGRNPTKGIGNKIARKIEKSFDKPHGWLDTLHSSLDDNDGKDQPATLRKATNAPNTDEIAASHSYRLLTRIVELEEKAKEFQEQAQLEQFRLEKMVASEFVEHMEKVGSKVRTNVYKNSYDLIDHPSWKRVTLHIPKARQPVVIYQNELEAINPDAVVIAIPNTPFTLFYAIPKKDYQELASGNEPLPGIFALTFDVVKITVNKTSLLPWGIFGSE